MVGYVTVVFDRKGDAPLEKEIHLKKKKKRGSSTGAGRYGQESEKTLRMEKKEESRSLVLLPC